MNEQEESICRANMVSERHILTKSVPVSITADELVESFWKMFYDELNGRNCDCSVKYGPISYLLIKDREVRRRYLQFGRWEESHHRPMTDDEERIYDSITNIEKWIKQCE